MRSFVDKIGDNWQLLYEKGVREIWFGVESGDINMRNTYNKPAFSNGEAIDVTVKGRENGINVCWFLVDNKDESDATKLATVPTHNIK